MVQQLRSSLDACVADLTYFLGVELWPFFAMKFLVQFPDKPDIGQIDKSIAHIAIILNMSVITLKSIGR